MKILVCTDGSLESRKAMEEAVKIVGGCRVSDVALIYVYDEKIPFLGMEYRNMTKEEYDRVMESGKEEGKIILEEAKKFFGGKDIAVRTILKGGHPAQVIAQTANEEGYDMIVIGSRGLGGLKRLFLGSTSNAVLQEAKTNVLVVK